MPPVRHGKILLTRTTTTTKVVGIQHVAKNHGWARSLTDQSNPQKPTKKDMQSYPQNSPQAAARVVALALLADGQLKKAELDMLDRLGAHAQLGLARAELRQVIHTFFEDLPESVRLSGSDACLSPRTIRQLMDEVDDPQLRRKVLRLCAALVEADGHVADSESMVLMAAVEQWGLHRWVQQAGRAQRSLVYV
jgi:uncharacterized tellurite resistance protein B-like protein